MNKIRILLSLTAFIGVIILFYISFYTSIFIPGTYVSNYKEGADTLKIFSNHKFTRISYPYLPEDKTCFIDTGSWEYEGGRERNIVFRYWYNRNQYDHFNDPENKGGIFVSGVDRQYFVGKMRIAIDYDMEYYYIKL